MKHQFARFFWFCVLVRLALDISGFFVPQANGSAFLYFAYWILGPAIFALALGSWLKLVDAIARRFGAAAQ